MAVCIYFENSLQRRPYTCEFTPRNCKEWTVKHEWLMNPTVVQKITLIKEDYFESYYYADLEIVSTFQKCKEKIVKSGRMASNNIQFVISGDEYSCFDKYFRTDNRENFPLKHMYRYKITLTPILTFRNEIFQKPGKRTKIDLIEGLKKFSDDISSLKDSEFCDIILHCGIKKAKAHRNILSARSALFNKFFHGAMGDEEIQKCLEMIISGGDDGGRNEPEQERGVNNNGETNINEPEQERGVNNNGEPNINEPEQERGINNNGEQTIHESEQETVINNNGEQTIHESEQETGINNNGEPPIHESEQGIRFNNNGEPIMHESEQQTGLDNNRETTINESEQETGSNNNGEISIMSTNEETEIQNNSEEGQLMNMMMEMDIKDNEDDNEDSSAMFIEECDKVQGDSKVNIKDDNESDDDENGEIIMKSRKHKEVQNGSKMKTYDNVRNSTEGKHAQNVSRIEIYSSNNNTCSLTTSASVNKDSKKEKTGFEANKNYDDIQAAYKEDNKIKDDSETETSDDECDSDYNAAAMSAENDALITNSDALAKCVEDEEEIQDDLRIEQDAFNVNDNNNCDVLATPAEGEDDQNDSEADLNIFSAADGISEDPVVIEIKLKQINPSIFDVFVDFIYSGRLQTVDIEKAKELLTAARAYGIYDLENKCIVYLKTQITMITCDDIYDFASKMDCEKLQNCVLDYIKNKVIGRTQRNVPFVPLTEEEKLKWMAIMRKHTAYLSDILKVKKNKKLRDVLWGDAAVACAECLEDILNNCVAILNNDQDLQL